MIAQGIFQQSLVSASQMWEFTAFLICRLNSFICMSKTLGLELRGLSGSAAWCFSLSQEPAHPHNSTLHFLGSSAIHLPSVKSLEWMVVEIIEGQTDRKTEIPCIYSKIVKSNNFGFWTVDWTKQDVKPKVFSVSKIVMDTFRIFWHFIDQIC